MTQIYVNASATNRPFIAQGKRGASTAAVKYPPPLPPLPPPSPTPPANNTDLSGYTQTRHRAPENALIHPSQRRVKRKYNYRVYIYHLLLCHRNERHNLMYKPSTWQLYTYAYNMIINICYYKCTSSHQYTTRHTKLYNSLRVDTDNNVYTCLSVYPYIYMHTKHKLDANYTI